jgi:hypothetical protein
VSASQIGRLHLAAAGILTLSAAYVGGWASLSPRGFYDAFPGLNRVWVSVDGPFNEHLVRDVGGLYLGLAVAGVLALLWRDGRSFVMLGAAWSVFSVLHLGYHLGHLGPLASTLDKAGEAGSLTVTLLLALALLLPGRDRKGTA